MRGKAQRRQRLWRHADRRGEFVRGGAGVELVHDAAVGIGRGDDQLLAGRHEILGLEDVEGDVRRDQHDDGAVGSDLAVGDQRRRLELQIVAGRAADQRNVVEAPVDGRCDRFLGIGQAVDEAEREDAAGPDRPVRAVAAALQLPRPRRRWRPCPRRTDAATMVLTAEKARCGKQHRQHLAFFQPGRRDLAGGRAAGIGEAGACRASAAGKASALDQSLREEQQREAARRWHRPPRRTAQAKASASGCVRGQHRQAAGVARPAEPGQFLLLRVLRRLRLSRPARGCHTLSATREPLAICA